MPVLQQEASEIIPAGASAHMRGSGAHSHVAFCCLPLLLPILFCLGLFGRGYWLLMPAGFLLVVAPLLDWITGWQDNLQFDKEDFSGADNFFVRWNTRLYAVF